MIYISHELKAIYIQSPKCGGLYIVDVLKKCYGFKEIPLKKSGDLKKNKRYEIFFDNFAQMQECNYSIDCIKKLGILRYFLLVILENEFFDIAYKNYFIFTFARNPYERLVSSFLYLKQYFDMEPPQFYKENLIKNENHYKKGVATFNNNFIKIDNITFTTSNDTKLNDNKYYETINNDNMSYYSDFNEYIKNYNKVVNLSFFHSFISQTQHFIDFENLLNINYIGNVENLDNDLIDILFKLGVTEIKHIDYLYNKLKINNSTYTKHIVEYYNEDSFNFINNFMSEDFDTFGYKKYNNYSDFCENFQKDKEKIINSNELTMNNLFRLSKISRYNSEKINGLDLEITGCIKNVFNNLELTYNIDENNIYFHTLKNEVLGLFDKRNELFNDVKTIDAGKLIDMCFMQNKDDLLACEHCGFKFFSEYSMKCHISHNHKTNILNI
jgi:hypothetical protein